MLALWCEASGTNKGIVSWAWWALQGDEVWWRLMCMDLDHEGLPVNNTGTGWAHCGQTLQDGPRLLSAPTLPAS